MSDERFKTGINLSCVDTETGKTYWYACNLRGLLNEQQATIEQLKSVLRKECNIITDEDLLEYVKTNGVSLNE